MLVSLNCQAGLTELYHPIERWGYRANMANKRMTYAFRSAPAQKTRPLAVKTPTLNRN